MTKILFVCLKCRDMIGCQIHLVRLNCDTCRGCDDMELVEICYTICDECQAGGCDGIGDD